MRFSSSTLCTAIATAAFIAPALAGSIPQFVQQSDIFQARSAFDSPSFVSNPAAETVRIEGAFNSRRPREVLLEARADEEARAWDDLERRSYVIDPQATFGKGSHRVSQREEDLLQARDVLRPFRRSYVIDPQAQFAKWAASTRG